MTGQTAKTKKIFDGRYEIISIVGRGARSVVYRARHVSSPHSEVALKVLINQKGKNPSAERLRREALAMVSCRHRYVARLDDFHSIGSLCYLSMEYAPESDLRNFVNKQGGKLSVEQAERFLKQSAEGVAFIHRAGIIHRDIKPENILVMNDKEVRITDFGVALLPGEECSIADLQSGVGTMNYMAPEILEGKPADQRSDLYALGVVFYELLCGQNPFQDSPLAKQIDVRKSESFPKLTQLDPAIPSYLSDLLFQCMHYDLDKRFNSCDELLANLLNKKSDNFSQEQKNLRQKPVRPKTNDLHKRPRKLQNKISAKESEDLFAEFDRLVSEESISANKDADTAKATETEAQSKSANLTDSGESSFESPVSESTVNSKEKVESSIFEDSTDASQDHTTQQLLDENVTEQQGPRSDDGKPSALDSLVEQISVEDSQENEFLDDDEDEPFENRNSKLRSTSFLSRRTKSRIVVLLAGLLLLAIIPGLRNSISSGVSSGIQSLAFWKETTLELPVFESTEVSFPNLPKGVFSGSLEGLFPGKSVPLTLISFGESGKIAVLLGIDGWTPVIIDQQGEQKNKILKINSSGILLEMNGEVKSDKIVGYFSNLINGTQGEWGVEPAI